MTCRVIRYSCSIYLLIVFSSCASRGMPGGGPVDRTPPEIIETVPHADSTSLKNLEAIIIRFSERMEESSVEDAIFISPPLSYETDWSGGAEITLSLTDSLKPDVTYVVTIGAGASDARKNRMIKSYQFAFSTGTTIQSGQIGGGVYGISPKDPFYVYAYSLSGDTMHIPDPTRQPADYLTQPGSDGVFALRFLALGSYRVFIVEDQNRNYILDADFERIGIPTRDVSLASGSTRFDALYFRSPDGKIILPETIRKYKEFR